MFPPVARIAMEVDENRGTIPQRLLVPRQTFTLSLLPLLFRNRVPKEAPWTVRTKSRYVKLLLQNAQLTILLVSLLLLRSGTYWRCDWDQDHRDASSQQSMLLKRDKQCCRWNKLHNWHSLLFNWGANVRTGMFINQVLYDTGKELQNKWCGHIQSAEGYQSHFHPHPPWWPEKEQMNRAAHDKHTST